MNKTHGRYQIWENSELKEEGWLYTFEEYQSMLLSELKGIFKSKFEKYAPQYKQNNLALGLLEDQEANALKAAMKELLAEYELRKTMLLSTTDNDFMEKTVRAYYA